MNTVLYPLPPTPKKLVRGLRLPLLNGVRTSLSRKYLLGMTGGLLAVSLVFLLLFLAMYRTQLAEERGEASIEINRLLQASLENAMLKRDLEGLRGIVARLGTQPGIVSVKILNPKLEVRFASDPSQLLTLFRPEWIPRNVTSNTTLFTLDTAGRDVPRSINPVHNKAPCVECHGAVADNPINGILVVDYNAAPILRHARNTTLMLMSSGAVVVFITLVGGWWFMRRFVLRPVKRLSDASEALSAGRLDTQVVRTSDDELGKLCDTFNLMTLNLRNSLNDLEDKEAFVQALIDADPDGIRAIGDDYRILKANRSYREQLELDATAQDHTYCYQSHGRSEPCPPTLVTCPLHEIAKHRKPLKAIHRHLRRNGAQFWVEVYAAPLENPLDSSGGAMIVESVCDLAHAVDYSHEQKLSALGELVAGVAHEIHNPLASVHMALQSIRRSISDGEQDRSQYRHYLGLVDQEIDKCIDVTQRLLKLSMFPGEERQLVAVNPAIEETVSLLVYEAGAMGIEIKLTLDARQPRILAIDSDLRLLVVNLIQNAFHATPDGGPLTITARSDGSDVKIEFEDAGVRIPPELIERVFDPFFSHRADKKSGTGLGLTISRRIAERYGGNIEVDSVLGRGTRFTVSFPDADRRNSS